MFPHSARHRVGLIGKTIVLVLCFVLGFSGTSTSIVRESVLLVSAGEEGPNSDIGPNPVPTNWHMENFTKTAQFFATLQAPDGGMMEAEDDPYENTDNTLESIWVWCRYYQLTGDNTYYPYVLNAWNYSIAHPAWLEDDSGKVYSSAWALAAEQNFREVYNNWTYSWYANSSMSFIVNVNALEPDIFLFNWLTRVHIRGWAAGNMYNYALGVGNETAKWKAVEYGNATMSTIEGDPTLLAQEGWALAGGTSMWGIWQSSMQEFPNATWMQTYGPSLRTEVTNPGVGAGNSQVGWEAWYAGGHYGVWNITSDKQYYVNFLDILDRQIAADGDDDGGLPTNYGEPDDTDESWVTSYRAFLVLDLFNKMPSGNAPGVADLQGADWVGAGGDVVLGWNPSGDDGAGESDVVFYEIYYSVNDLSCGYGVLNFTRLGVVFAGSYVFDHSGAGADSKNYTYYVATRDYEGWRTSSNVYGGKCAIPLSSGMNLVSIPFRTHFADASFIFFEMWNLESAWTYDTSDPANPWKLYDPQKPFNDLSAVDVTMGVWVNVSANANLYVAGIVLQSVLIPIKSGWNLIGFPSMTNDTLGNVLSGISYDRVEAYDPSSPPYHLKAVGDTYLMQAGKALWVHALSDGSILIQN